MTTRDTASHQIRSTITLKPHYQFGKAASHVNSVVPRFALQSPVCYPHVSQDCEHSGLRAKRVAGPGGHGVRTCSSRCGKHVRQTARVTSDRKGTQLFSLTQCYSCSFVLGVSRMMAGLQQPCSTISSACRPIFGDLNVLRGSADHGFASRSRYGN